jgi:hypothetical protein
MSPRFLVFLTIPLFTGAAALFAEAPPCPDPSEKVKVSVVVILASETKDKVDPELKCIAKELTKKYKNLTGFTVSGKMSCKSIAVGTSGSFDLIADQKASVIVEQGADKDDKVILKVTPPMMGEITYETICGKFLPIVTPVKTKDGEILILAVRVQPCNGGK